LAQAVFWALFRSNSVLKARSTIIEQLYYL
jgi:hypothetical protein